MRLLIGLWLLGLGAAGAETVVNPEDLARRIEAAQSDARPVLQIKVALLGCEIRVDRAGANGGTESGRFWLADLQTDPALLWGEADWPGHVAYQWRPEVIAANAGEVARWQKDYAGIRFLASEGVDINLSTDQQDAAVAWNENRLNRQLHKAAGQGLYGPFFQRNQTWLEWPDPQYGASFAVREMVFTSKSEGGEITGFLAPLHFYMAEPVAVGLITDLHLYAQQACAQGK